MYRQSDSLRALFGALQEPAELSVAGPRASFYHGELQPDGRCGNLQRIYSDGAAAAGTSCHFQPPHHARFAGGDRGGALWNEHLLHASAREEPCLGGACVCACPGGCFCL